MHGSGHGGLLGRIGMEGSSACTGHCQQQAQAEWCAEATLRFAWSFHRGTRLGVQKDRLALSQKRFWRRVPSLSVPVSVGCGLCPARRAQVSWVLKPLGPCQATLTP